MNITLAILLGIIDTVALMAIAFILWRIPFFEYIKEVLILSVVVSCLSYVLRQMDVTVVDLACQTVLYVIFFRTILKIRFPYYLYMPLMGYASYIMISYFAATFLVSMNIVSQQALGDSTGGEIFFVQAVVEAIAFALTYLLHRFQIGFSYILRPPHNEFVREKLKRSEMWIIGLSLAVAIVAIFLYPNLPYVSLWILTPLIALPFVLLLLTTLRRDNQM